MILLAESGLQKQATPLGGGTGVISVKDLKAFFSASIAGQGRGRP